MNRRKAISLLLSLIMLTGALFGCADAGTSTEIAPAIEAAPYDGSNYERMSDLTDAAADIEAAAASYEPVTNFDTKLSVPTYITRVDDLWFIVDCYHNRVIYSDSLDKPLNQWLIMCDKAYYPHTIASDGTVYLVDDTENNRVLIYEKCDGKFINTQAVYDIGVRPHYSVYDKATDTFYVWGSESGQMYCLRHTPDSSRMYVTDVKTVDQLTDMYVRSFTIVGDEIYFVSGVSPKGASPKILICDLETFEVKRTIDVPNELAGMVQIMPVDGAYFITVSTDITGSQDYATIVSTKSLEDLSKGKYEDIYSTYFAGGGTPYNIGQVDDTYFLTEHRLTDHQIWSFKVKKGKVTDVNTVF